MAHDQWPGQIGQQGQDWRQGGSDGRWAPPEWQFQGGYADTQEVAQFGPSVQNQGVQLAGGDGRWQPPEWRYREDRYVQDYPEPSFHPVAQPGPGTPGAGTPGPGAVRQPARPPRRRKPWSIGQKVLTGVVGIVALIGILAGIGSCGTPATPAPAGNVTTSSASASQTPSRPATHKARSSVRETPTEQAQATATATVSHAATHAPAPVAPTRTTPATVRTTPAVVVTTSSAPVTTSAPPSPAGCTPKTSSGNCYNAGEFCPKADAGMSGVAGNGEAITCEEVSGRLHWEPA